MTRHATPEQWQRVISWKAEGSYCESCLLELRDRIEVLEAQRETDKLCEEKQSEATAPADGLVEQVIKAQELINQYRIGGERLCAHAAILAVADVMEARGWGNSARWLREEVERG